MEKITPTRLAQEVGISVPYASQLLSGARPISTEMALRIFDATGEKIGPFVGLTAAEIRTARKLVRA